MASYIQTYRQSLRYQDLEAVPPITLFDAPRSSNRFETLKHQHNRGSEKTRTHVIPFADGGMPLLIKTKTGSEEEIAEAVMARRHEFGKRSPILNFKGAPNLKGMDLSGVTLTGTTPKNLEGANLKGATILTGGATKANKANLQGATLGANLEGSELARADLRGVKTLGSVNLTRAKMRGAKLQGAQLTGSFGGAEMQQTQLEGTTFSGYGEGMNLSSARGSISLKNMNLRYAELSGAHVAINAENSRLEGVRAFGAAIALAVNDGTSVSPDSFMGAKVDVKNPNAKPMMVLPSSSTRGESGMIAKAFGLDKDEAPAPSPAMTAARPDLFLKHKKQNPNAPMSFAQRCAYLQAAHSPAPM